MLFSSLTFIFAFLPLALAAVLLRRRLYGSFGARFALTAASLLFYGFWGWKLLPVLILVAGLNYRVSYSIARSAAGPRKRWLVFGIASNLLILIAFKYTNFLIDNVNAITGFAVPFADIAFPIGISFFTFQQIAYLVAVANSMEPPESFWEYLLFVSCFAYVTAGPIVGAREFFSQRDQIGRLTTDRFAVAIPELAMETRRTGSRVYRIDNHRSGNCGRTSLAVSLLPALIADALTGAGQEWAGCSLSATLRVS